MGCGAQLAGFGGRIDKAIIEADWVGLAGAYRGRVVGANGPTMPCGIEEGVGLVDG